MRITVTDLESGRLATMDIPNDLNVETLNELIKSDFGISSPLYVLYKGQRPLSNGNTSLCEAGILDNDVLVLQKMSDTVEQQTTVGATSNSLNEVLNFDFSSISIPPKATHIPPVDGNEGSAIKANRLLTAARNDPDIINRIMMQDEELAAALTKDDLDSVTAVVIKHEQNEREKFRKAQLAMRDPMSFEAQELLLTAVKQHNIDESYARAQEWLPESFALVPMVYVKIEVNGKPIAAFVDSGAQTTIMSKRCAEKCEMLRFVDNRFHGIAQGVGTTAIIGRIHIAQIKMGLKFFDASITVIDDDKVDFLFGLDLLRRYQCSIDFKGNYLNVNDEKLQFLTESEVEQFVGLSLFSVRR